jgi:hypothetical protein
MLDFLATDPARSVRAKSPPALSPWQTDTRQLYAVSVGHRACLERIVLVHQDEQR